MSADGPLPAELAEGPALSDVEFIALDVETTGLSAAHDRIIEIGAIRFLGNGTVLDQFESLVDPGIAIKKAATAVNGITDDLVRGKPRIEEVLPEFLTFLGDDSTILVGHNVGFDLRFISAVAARLGIQVPQWPVIDTLRLSRTLLPDLPNRRLGTIANPHISSAHRT